MSQDFPFVGKFPLSDYIDAGLDWMTQAFSGVTRGISTVLGGGVEAAVAVVTCPPP